MNSKQRRQRKRQALNLAEKILNISIDLLDDIEKGETTIAAAKEDLAVSKKQLLHFKAN